MGIMPLFIFCLVWKTRVWKMPLPLPDFWWHGFCISKATSLEEAMREWTWAGLGHWELTTPCYPDVSSLALCPQPYWSGQAKPVSDLAPASRNFTILWLFWLHWYPWKTAQLVSEPAVKCGCLVSTGSYQEGNAFYGILKARTARECLSLLPWCYFCLASELTFSMP